MNEAQFHIPERYKAIEHANETSWFYDDETPRPFETYYSIGALQPSRRIFGEGALRQTLAGNMSPLYEPKSDAKPNMLRFYESLGLTRADLESSVILYPQRQYDIPLQMIDADNFTSDEGGDKEPRRPDTRADMLVTRNPDQILAVRPADCPVIFASGDTPEGKILSLTHFAWGGAAVEFVEQMFDKFDELGVNRDSLKMYVTPGAQAENYPYFNKNDPRSNTPLISELFKDVQPGQKEIKGELVDGFTYNIDTPRFVYDELLRLGMKSEQIYADVSDTAHPDSGFSSHSRAFNSGGREKNIRDIMIAKMN